MPAAPRIVPRPRTALAPAYELREEVGTPTDIGPPPFSDVFPDDEPPTPWVGAFALKPAANEYWIPGDPTRVGPPSHEQLAVSPSPERQAAEIQVTEEAESGERDLTTEDRLDLMPKFFALGGHEIEAAPSLVDERSPSQSEAQGFRASLTPPLPLVSRAGQLTAEDVAAIHRMSRFPPGAGKRAVEMIVLGSVIAVAAFALIASVVTVLRAI